MVPLVILIVLWMMETILYLYRRYLDPIICMDPTFPWLVCLLDYYCQMLDFESEICPRYQVMEADVWANSPDSVEWERKNSVGLI